MAQRVSEYVELDGGRLRCTECGHDLCDAAENYKLWVLQDRGPLTEIPGAGDPAPYEMSAELEFRRYYCPGCAVQLDTEVALPDEPPLWDFEVQGTANGGS